MGLPLRATAMTAFLTEWALGADSCLPAAAALQQGVKFVVHQEAGPLSWGLSVHAAESTPGSPKGHRPVAFTPWCKQPAIRGQLSDSIRQRSDGTIQLSNSYQCRLSGQPIRTFMPWCKQPIIKGQLSDSVISQYIRYNSG